MNQPLTISQNPGSLFSVCMKILFYATIEQYNCMLSHNACKSDSKGAIHSHIIK